MITLDFVTNFILENIENVLISDSGRHFNGRCPICGDSKRSKKKRRFHLQYSPDVVKWHCFNCNAKGNFLTLYAHIKGISSKEAYSELYSFSYDNVEKLLEAKKNNTSTSTKTTSKNPPNFNWILKDCLSLDDTPSGLIQTNLYNKLKNFKNSRCVNVPLYIAYQGYYRNRIIIPIFENNNLIYFQARRTNSNISNKYLNPKVEKESIILNKENFDSTKSIIVTEGLLDAYSIGNQGTACLGKTITKHLLDILFELTTKNIILAFDNDEDGMKELNNFLENNFYAKNVKYFLMPYDYKYVKDINKLKTIFHKEKDINMYNYIIDNSYDYFTTSLKLQTETWRNRWK